MNNSLVMRKLQGVANLRHDGESLTWRNPTGERIKIVAVVEAADPSVALSDAMVGLFDGTGELAAQWTARPSDLGRERASHRRHGIDSASTTDQVAPETVEVTIR